MSAVQLPSTLSALLRIAVEDAQKIEKTPGYVLDMDAWHIPASDGCHVCMAGAVIAARGIASADEEVTNFTMRELPQGHLLEAIDDMRAGDVERAARRLGVKLTVAQRDALEEIGGEYAGKYEAAEAEIDDPDRLLTRLDWSDYLAIADRLEGAGL